MAGELAHLLGITEPIVLGPFGGASSIELTAARQRRGRPRLVRALRLQPAAHPRDDHAACAPRTDKPFAVNLWLPTGEEVRPRDVDLGPYLDALAPLYAAAGVSAPDRAGRVPPGDRRSARRGDGCRARRC